MPESSQSGKKYPLEYRLGPLKLEKGENWLSFSMKNLNTDALHSLGITLISKDMYALSSRGEDQYIDRLDPGKSINVAFRVLAKYTARAYVSLDGWHGNDRFHWESPRIRITVGEQKAELVSLFALTEPYPQPGQVIRCEALIKALKDHEALRLEFWLEDPAGEFEEIDHLSTKAMRRGGECRYAADFIPRTEGLYIVHSYLYDGETRLGNQYDRVLVEKRQLPGPKKVRPKTHKKTHKLDRPV